MSPVWVEPVEGAARAAVGRARAAPDEAAPALAAATEAIAAATGAVGVLAVREPSGALAPLAAADADGAPLATRRLLRPAAVPLPDHAGAAGSGAGGGLWTAALPAALGTHLARLVDRPEPEVVLAAPLAEGGRPFGVLALLGDGRLAAQTDGLAGLAAAASTLGLVVTQHAARERLREAEVARDRTERAVEDLGRVLAAAGIGVWVLDEDGRTRDVDDVIAALLGEPPEALAGRAADELVRGLGEGGRHPVPPVDVAGPRRLHLVSGATVLATFQPLVEDDGRRAGAIVSVVAEDRSGAADADERARRTRAILDAARDAVVSVGPDGRVVYANPAVSRVLGWDATDLPGRQLLEELVPPARRDELAPLLGGTGDAAGRVGFDRRTTGVLLGPRGEAVPVEILVTAGGEGLVTLHLRPADAGAGADADPVPGEGELPLREAAAALGVSASTLRRWADAGAVPAARTAGGHRRFAARDVERLAARHRADPSSAPRAPEPPDRPAPALPGVLRRHHAEVLDAVVDRLYAPGAEGWFARPRGRAALETWLRVVAAAAGEGDRGRALEATRTLADAAYAAGARLAELVAVLERARDVLGRAASRAGAPRDEPAVIRMWMDRLRDVALHEGGF